jgi:hypothetical protein
MVRPQQRAEQEYLVRWSGKAHWHCSWVPESFLAEMARIKLKNFKQKQVGRSLGGLTFNVPLATTFASCGATQD